MPKPNLRILFPGLLILIGLNTSAQYIKGVVTDSSGRSLAFATIRIGETKQGMMADLNGKFRIRYNGNISFITVTHLGYVPMKVNLHQGDTSLTIMLESSPASLEDVVISSSPTKLKRIINNAINNRNRNNPDKYDWYQCNIYYKTTIDISSNGSTGVMIPADTSADAKHWREMMDQQHMFITETYSKRTWEKPQKLQEDIMASRVSGFKKAWFTSLVTDVLPFHAYNDFITLNGKDYHNPLSNGFYQRFYFRIEDEVLKDKDTVWVISFKPRKDPENLSGTLFINSNGFALSHLEAQHYDTSLRRLIGLEQQYVLEQGKWFPDRLNYFIDWNNLMGMTLHMKGTSSIDSISYTKKEGFKFDKAHTARLQPRADHLTNNEWKEIRPVSLSAKEERTYEFIDSVGNKHQFDKLPLLAETLVDGYFPAGKVDIELQRLYTYNPYEKARVGFGLRTSKEISRKFSLGGWFGYGFGDKSLKYGGFAEIYADRYREFKFRLAYQNDLRDPGRLQISPELDKNFLRRFTLGRVDKVKSWSVEMFKKLGYLDFAIGYNDEEIFPQYNYLLDHSGKTWNQFHAREITLGFRYAYAERMAPIFGKYLSNGTKYPIVYGKLRFGQLGSDNSQYVHAVAAVKWQKQINRVGNEQFLLMAGGVFSKSPLPLGKLFAGNGFQTENQSFYVFGGMQTMLPYDYYSDRFINFYWKHEFDFKFYKTKLTRNLSSSPMLSLGYNVLWGTLQNAGAHKFVSFSVPDPAYHEAGVLLNRIIRLKVLSMMYLNFNAGYFYHLSGAFDHAKNGRFVFGISADL